MSHWFIIEPHLTGHRIKYLQEFADAALRSGHQVSVALAERAENQRILEAGLLPRGPNITYMGLAIPADHNRFGGVLNDLRREFAYWRFARTACRSRQAVSPIDAVLFPYFDYCINVCGLIGPPMRDIPIFGVVMRPIFHFAAMGVQAPARRFTRWRQWLFARALRHQAIRAVMAIDLTLHTFAQTQPEVQWRKVRYMPDPAERGDLVTQSQARAELGLPASARVLLIYGALDGRKGLASLFAALAHSSPPQDLHIVLAGRLSADIRHAILAPDLNVLRLEGRLHIHDRRIADDEEPRFFSAADAVWLGYKGHYTMSGVLLKAGRFGRQVLAGQDGLIGWFASRMPTAISLGAATPAQIAHALHQIQPVAQSPAHDLFPDHEWPQAIQRALPELLAPPTAPLASPCASLCRIR